ncbi:hypothetical protein ACFFGV_15945 [Pontibacillus salicampi]|uniref:Uncharacterized protein n=1 Tax=Pontibacillus salicampi TaxID=1449801 RepID=A0ABV6LS40_9BACI
MKVLSTKAYKGAMDFILEKGRPLEKSLFQYEFNNGSAEEVLKALKSYQNEDGGFGNGLEADFRLKASSPMATSVALQHLVRLADHPQADEMITLAIQYLEYTFLEERQGWLAVPPEVNDYPHAFWWSVHDNGMSWIDENWGNPSAELIGYLHLFEDKVQVLQVPKLVDQAVQHLLELKTFESEHEMYCYLRLLAMVPAQRTEKVERQLTKAVQSLVKLDRENWEKYVPFPLKFIPTPEANHFGIPAFKVEDNLDFFIDKLEEHGRITPPWEWTTDLDVWEQAKQEWSGTLTLGALISLRTFNRL